MKSRAFAVIAAVALLSPALPAAADFTFTVTKDSTMDGNDGKLMRVAEPGYPSEDFFMFVQDGYVRVYAHRDNSDGSWTIPLVPLYFVPQSTISQGQTWSFLPMGGVALTVAEAVAQEQKTVSAGTFECWRVDVTALGSPETVITTFWFSSGVGMVAQVEYNEGKATWRTELDNYSVTGAGYFPLVLGNTWDFLGLEVAGEVSSLGALKGRFSH